MKRFSLLLTICLLSYLNLNFVKGECEVVTVSNQSSQISVSLWINTTSDCHVIGYFREFNKSTDCIKIIPKQLAHSNGLMFVEHVIVNYHLNLSNVKPVYLKISYEQNGSQSIVEDIHRLNGNGKIWSLYSQNMLFNWANGVIIELLQ